MKPKTLSDTWNRIIQLNDNFFPGWRNEELIYWTNALAGEVGELCNTAKHIRGGGTHKISGPTLRRKERKEIADTFIYLALLCESEGIMMEDFIKEVEKVNRLNIRRMKGRQ